MTRATSKMLETRTGKQGEKIKSMPRLNVAEEYEVNDFFKT